jgi:hypothetical protein
VSGAELQAQAPVGPPLAIAAYSGDGHGRDPGTRGARERRHKDGKKESKRHKKEKRHKKDKLKDKEKPSKVRQSSSMGNV